MARWPWLFTAASLFLVGGARLGWAQPSSIGEIDVQAGPPVSAPAGKDGSGLWIHAGTRAYLMVIDSQGKKTGVDSKTQATVQEIPNSTCDADFMENRYTGDPHAEIDEHITIKPAVKGSYYLHLLGLQEGPYEVSIAALSREGSSLPSKDLDGLISEGQEKVFKLSFDPAPNTRLSVVEESGR